MDSKNIGIDHNKPTHLKDDSNGGYRSFLLLDEISKNNSVTQRDLSKKVGVALGLINSYMKNLASKGYITVSQIPSKRYKYYITPKGFKEKTRLTYEHLRNFTNLYKVARQDFRSLFSKLEGSNIKKLAFCGVGEVAEIAYLSLQETNLELISFVGDTVAGVEGSVQGRFLGKDIVGVENAKTVDCDLFIVTYFADSSDLLTRLKSAGVPEEKICDISNEGWLKRLEDAGIRVAEESKE